MASQDPATANCRYLLRPSDSSQLYRQYMSALGINTLIAPQYNVQYWLDPTSPSYNPTIAAAIFHYVPRIQKEDRFQICIATPEMQDASWSLSHRKQLVFDGTFGVCSARLMLFIALGIQGNGKGMPLALFLFSAPTGNQASHAGYDTQILTELLKSWVKTLNKRPLTLSGSATPPSFEPFSVITDTDTKERGALSTIWPEVTLLLCKFHVRQCWKNRRRIDLKGINDKVKQKRAQGLIQRLEER